MDKNLRSKVNLKAEAVPVELIEVPEQGVQFETTIAAEQFLGIASGVLASYVRGKVKLIKSKVDGKTYLIRKSKQ